MKETFNNPEVYLRKWIAEAFAGILSDPELGFAWYWGLNFILR